jgi:hypothetical protein
MRKIIVTLPIVALGSAALLLFSEAGGAFSGAEPVPTPEPTAVAQAATAEPGAADWVETRKAKPKPTKSAHHP